MFPEFIKKFAAGFIHPLKQNHFFGYDINIMLYKALNT